MLHMKLWKKLVMELQWHRLSPRCKLKSSVCDKELGIGKMYGNSKA
jgi:hypothetical protein